MSRNQVDSVFECLTKNVTAMRGVFLIIILAIVAIYPRVSNPFTFDGIIDHEVIIEEVKEPSFIEVTATVYNPTPFQCNEDYHITADGSIIDTLNPSKHRWIALSRDLHARYGGKFSFGDTIVIEGTGSKLDGVHVVRDLMNKRFTKKIDFLVSENDIYGKWDNVTIRKHTEDNFLSYK